MWISLKTIFFSGANFLSAHLSTFLLLVLPLIATATVKDWEGDAWFVPASTGLGSRYEFLKKKSIYSELKKPFQKLLGASKNVRVCNCSSLQSHLGDKSGQNHNWSLNIYTQKEKSHLKLNQDPFWVGRQQRNIRDKLLSHWSIKNAKLLTRSWFWIEHRSRDDLILLITKPLKIQTWICYYEYWSNIPASN